MQQPTTADLLRRAVDAMRGWQQARDDYIVQRRTEGATLRQIASECDLSPTTVQTILRERDVA